MKITGNKVVLRSLQQTDLGYLYNWRSNTDVRKNLLLHPFPMSRELENKWFSNVLTETNNKRVLFGIALYGKEALIGYTVLNEINWISRNAYLGILIGEGDQRGQGLGTEALNLILEFAFNQLNLHKLSLEVLAENKPAISIYERLGFHKEGCLKENFFWKGQWLDVIVMGRFSSQMDV